MNKQHTPLTGKILIALIAGALTGIVLNLLSGTRFSEPIQQWLVGGLFDITGRLFISAIRMLVVPLVLTSLICGAAGISDIKKLGRIGGKTVLLYLATTAIAISIALAVSFSINPGKGFSLQVNAAQLDQPPAASLMHTISSIIPDNPFTAFAEGHMLQIIFFALMFGFSMAALGKEAAAVKTVIESLNAVVMKMVLIIMRTAPVGVFALVATVFAREGFAAFLPLMQYVLCVTVALCLHVVFTYGCALKLFTHLSPITFIKKFNAAIFVAFSTASSNATLPITMETAEQELGVSKNISSFTLPLGATVNMDGTAIMQGAAVVFIAQAYGIDLSLTALLTVVLTATLASIGTAGVPGVGLITLSMVLMQVGLPVEGIALIMGIDRILDMLRTAVNVSGDGIVTLIVAQSEGGLDEEIFNARSDGTLLPPTDSQT
jgi:Na+/H+-dicarboxylate symporter